MSRLSSCSGSAGMPAITGGLPDVACSLSAGSVESTLAGRDAFPPAGEHDQGCLWEGDNIQNVQDSHALQSAPRGAQRTQASPSRWNGAAFQRAWLVSRFCCRSRCSRLDRSYAQRGACWRTSRMSGVEPSLWCLNMFKYGYVSSDDTRSSCNCLNIRRRNTSKHPRQLSCCSLTALGGRWWRRHRSRQRPAGGPPGPQHGGRQRRRGGGRRRGGRQR